MSESQEPPWQAIARRKQSHRSAELANGVSISVPDDLLPKDPPLPEHGAQIVLDIPRKLLSDSEFSITEQSVRNLLSNIRSGKISAVESTSAFCKRASIAQQLTNCITEPLFASALKRAAFLDDYLSKKGKPFGPLHGLAVSVKDTFNVKGVDSSIGLAALCFKPAPLNAPLVDLLLSLGCVIITKTNIPQTLASLDSINNIFGRTMNPMNRLCTAGGSSGGEGVLVAMKGSAVGWGTDVGGSIRIPAMCNGVIGFKPSNGRIPYGGQGLTGLEGMSRTSVQAVAGPIGRSMDDIDIVMSEVVPRASSWGDDCMPGTWSLTRPPWPGHDFHRPQRGPFMRSRGSGPQGEYVIGILRSDGNCQLLPPVENVINEVSATLQASNRNIKIVDLPTPVAWTQCQSLMSKLMSVDGGETMADYLSSAGEPLVPWMSTRFRKGKPRSLVQVAELQARRTQLERQMLKLWWSEDKHGRRTRKVDAVICALAPHPVPEIERYNAVGYTSSWVLLDYPAGSIPIRQVMVLDLELGKPFKGQPVLGSWDEKSLELWDEDKTDRRVYLGTALSIQVVTPRLEDENLAYAMGLVERALKGHGGKRRSLKRARL